MEAAAKYLNDELEKRTITASVLADYIKAAAEAVDIERSIKTTSTDVVSLRLLEAGAAFVQGRRFPLKSAPGAAKFNLPLWLICDELKKAKPPVMRKPTALRG